MPPGPSKAAIPGGDSGTGAGDPTNPYPSLPRPSQSPKAQVQLLREKGLTVREVSRVLGVPKSTVSRWDRDRQIGTRQAKPPVKSSPGVERLSQTPDRPRTVIPGVIRGRFAGTHDWFWTAPVEKRGRDLLLSHRKSLAGSLVWWEKGIEFRGESLTVERHLPNRGGEGSIVVRFRLDAGEGEDPEAHFKRVQNLLTGYLDHLREARGLHTSRAKLSKKPHYVVRGDSLAQKVGQVARVQVRDSYGWVWVDYSHVPGGGWQRGDREADTWESTRAYLRLDGNLSSLLNQLPMLVSALEKHSEIMRGLVGGPEPPQKPREPEGGYA